MISGNDLIPSCTSAWLSIYNNNYYYVVMCTPDVVREIHSMQADEFIGQLIN